MKNTLIIHDNNEALAGLVRTFEIRGWSVAALSTLNLSLNQLRVSKYDMVIIHATDGEKTNMFLRDLKASAFTSHIPVFALVPERDLNDALMGRKARGSDIIMPDTEPPDQVADRAEESLISNHSSSLDHLTGLLTGAPLMRIVDDMCATESGDWCFMALKLSGLKPFNTHYGYEKGDELVLFVANMLRETIEQEGHDSDILGRIGGDTFCVVTKSRKVESLCRKARVKSERGFRKYYSPFELSKGYITIETKHGKDDFVLAELLIAAAYLSSGWSGNPAYLMDIVKDLLTMLENNDNGYVVYKV